MVGSTQKSLKQLDLQTKIWNWCTKDFGTVRVAKAVLIHVAKSEIVYAESNKKIYGADRLISIMPKNEKKGETIRSMDDYEFDFTKLTDLQNDERIAKVRYYTEIPEIEDELKKYTKFENMELWKVFN